MAQKLSRRNFLKFSAIGTTGAVLAAYIPVVGVAAQDGSQPKFDGVTLIVMYPDGEFPQEYRDQILSESGIKIDFLQEDLNRLSAMWAAGTPPDIWRANALQIGPHVVRNQVLPLNDYVDASSLIKWDDLQPAYLQHMYDGTKVGSGQLYGIPKDWGTDFLLYVNVAAFEEAGLEVPSESEPLSYAQLFELAGKLTKQEGDRTLRWGIESHYWQEGPMAQFLLEVLPQVEGSNSLYNEDFSELNLAQNETVREVFQKWFEAAQAHYVPSSVDPMPSWFGQVFTQGSIGIAQAGYWYGAMAESEITAGKVVVLPAPYWTSLEARRDSSVWATATVGSSRTANPDAVWRVIEYYSGGKPAEDRAVTGWGVPILKSMFDLLPQDTEYNQQRYRVLSAELDFAQNSLTYSPYVEGFTGAPTTLQSALEGQITLDDALAQIEAATNEAIFDTRDRLSAS